MSIRHFNLAMALVVIGFVGSCSSAVKEKNKEKDAAAEGASSKDAQAAPPSSPQDPAEANLTGIPGSCRVADQLAAGDFCIVCKPRLLEVDHCFNSKGIADIVKSCSHDGENVSCHDDEGKDLKFAIKPNVVEQAFEALPLITAVARSFVAEKLKGKTNELAWANAALDFADKYAEDIFKGTNTAAVADAVVANVARFKTDLTQEQSAGLKKVTEKGLAEIAKELRTAKVRPGVLVKIASDAAEGLPFDSIGNGTSKIDLVKLRELLKSEDMKVKPVQALLTFFKLGSPEDLLKRFQDHQAK